MYIYLIYMVLIVVGEEGDEWYMIYEIYIHIPWYIDVLGEYELYTIKVIK